MQTELYAKRWWALGALCLSLVVIGSTTRSSTSRCRRSRRDLGATRQPAAVDRRRLHPRVRRPAADGGQPRRPVRSQAGPHHRPRDLRRRLGRVGVRAARPPTLIGTRALMGVGRRVHHAGDAVDHHQRLPDRRERGQGDRHLGRRVGPRRSASARSRAACCSSTSGGVRSSSSTSRSSSSASSPATCSSPSRATRGRAARPGRRGPVDRRPGRRCLRAIIEAPSARLDLHRDRSAALRRSASSCSAVRRLGAAHPSTRCSTSTSSRTRGSARRAAAITLVFFALFGTLFLLTQYLQFVLGYSPLEAGRPRAAGRRA